METHVELVENEIAKSAGILFKAIRFSNSRYMQRISILH